MTAKKLGRNTSIYFLSSEMKRKKINVSVGVFVCIELAGMCFIFCDEPISCCVLFRFHFIFRTNRLSIIVLGAFIPLTARVCFSFCFRLFAERMNDKSLLKFNERNFSFVSALSVFELIRLVSG